MIIPNDDDLKYRLNKFVEYQHKVPPVHRPILVQYCLEKKLSKSEMVLLAWLMSNTYHEITSILMFEAVKFDENYCENFSSWYKLNQSKIQFGSAKKYNKIQLRFLDTINFYFENYGINSYDKLLNILQKQSDSADRYEELIRFNKTCKNHGRFSSDLFNEIIILFQDEFDFKTKIKGSDIFDWENCSNLTSAVFNILYLDDLADKFDKGNFTKSELIKYEPILNKAVLNIKNEIFKTYGKEVDVPMFITKLCSFRNLFKNARYGGFHHDRQLEYLLKYNKDLPQFRSLYEFILRSRKENFNQNLLGELNNWNGIRKNRKKIWTLYGLTGVELKSKNLLN